MEPGGERGSLRDPWHRRGDPAQRVSPGARPAPHRPGSTGPWYLSAWIDDKGRSDVATARERATRWGKTLELEGKVVAELSFGFWRYLVAKRYQTTAWPALQWAFPLHSAGGSTPRGEVEDRMQRIHVLRNRIAHHEPIFRRNLSHDHADMLTLVGWISEEAQGWVEDRSRVRLLLAERPTS